MEYSIIWLLFFIGCAFIFSAYAKKMRKFQKIRKEQQLQFENNREKYRHFTSELFDETPDEEMTHAVLFHIMGKEDKIYDGDKIGNVIDVLTHSELLIYTIYQVELSLEGGRGSLHTFFIKEPYCTYRPYAKEAFEAVDCHEIAELMEAADKLATAIENDEEIDVDDNSDYGNYNFSDFTNALASSLKTSGILLKAAKFIREHKDEFVETEVKEENDE